MPTIIEKILFKYGGKRLRISIARKWGVKIGKNSYINPPCNILEPYLVVIGNECLLAGNNILITHDGAIRIYQKDKKKFNEIHTLFGPIVIKDNSFVGVNSIILPNVIIGPNSVIGAGSVVTKDVPPNTVYAGNPAKLICTYDEFYDKCKKKSTGDLPRKTRKELLLKKFSDILNG